MHWGPVMFPLSNRGPSSLFSLSNKTKPFWLQGWRGPEQGEVRFFKSLSLSLSLSSFSFLLSTSIGVETNSLPSHQDPLLSFVSFFLSLSLPPPPITLLQFAPNLVEFRFGILFPNLESSLNFSPPRSLIVCNINLLKFRQGKPCVGVQICL